MSFEPELVGGHVLLDLLNTVSWRLDPARRIDRIADPAARDVWLRAVELPPGGDGLEEVRETAYDVLQPLAVGEEPSDGEALRVLMVGAVARARIVRLSPLRWQADDAAGELALAALRLLADEDLSRLRQCQDNDCGWLFLDRSKNGSRRWCSSADCGNRARAKRHYARTRAR
ncbi:CGNR zinc finger domain-containing protein [Kribbella endophytica]